MKFRNEADFSRALGFLRDLGLPILDNVQPAPKFRPTPSPAPSAASSSTLSAGSFQMSYTPAPVAQLFTPSFGRSLDTPALSPAKSEFKIPTRPESSNSEVQRSFSALAFQTSAATPPLSATSSSLALDLSHCRSQAEKGVSNQFSSIVVSALRLTIRLFRHANYLIQCCTLRVLMLQILTSDPLPFLTQVRGPN